MVNSETKEQIDYLSNVTGKSKTSLIAEIFGEIFGIAASLKPCHGCKRINVQIYSSILSQEIKIQLLGRSTIITGIRPVSEETAEIEAKAEPIVVIIPEKKVKNDD